MKKYLGIDVGGTKTKYGIYTDEGTEIDSGIVDSEKYDLNKFVEVITNIKNKYSDIEGLALSLPCVLDSDSGLLLEASNFPAIEHKNIKKILEEKLEVKVEIENDANCVALAEKWIGNGKDISNFICVTLGTGIGGAIIINDKLIKGKNFAAGEFGYMLLQNTINTSDEKDFGHYASTSGLVRFVKEKKKDETREINGHYIFEKLEEKDKEVEEAYNYWLTTLAIGIRNLCFTLDPEKVLIGGGVSAQEKILIDLKNKVKAILPDGYNMWNIESCKHFNDSGKLGAIYNFIQKQIEN